MLNGHNRAHFQTAPFWRLSWRCTWLLNFYFWLSSTPTLAVQADEKQPELHMWLKSATHCDRLVGWRRYQQPGMETRSVVRWDFITESLAGSTILPSLTVWTFDVFTSQMTEKGIKTWVLVVKLDSCKLTDWESNLCIEKPTPVQLIKVWVRYSPRRIMTGTLKHTL